MRVTLAVLMVAVTYAAAFGGSRGVAAAPGQPEPQYTGDVIVRFEDDATLLGVGDALGDAAAMPLRVSPSGLVLADLEGGRSVDDAVAALNAHPDVKYAEPDLVVTIDATPNDTFYAGYQAWQFDQINAPEAWDAETGDNGTVVAVVDTGVQTNHPDLDTKLVGGENFVTVPIASSSNAGGVVRVTTSTPHPYLSGEQVTLSGHSVAGLNTTWTVSVPTPANITSSSTSAGTVTVTTSSAHGLQVGDFVMIRDHSVGAANGQWQVSAVPSATQFRFFCDADGNGTPECSNGSGSGGKAKQASWFTLNGSSYTSAGTGGLALGESVRDDEGHGTFVAGLIGAESNNAAGVTGTCWQCSIMPVKALGANGSGTTLSVADAIEWAADNGADVINLSLSASGPSQTLEDAVNYAWSLGAIVVAASGNQNSAVSYPARYTNVVAVGATTSSGVRASFSNYGPELDLVAPGASVTSTSTQGFGDAAGWYGTGSGTSFAAPHVAGVVGLMISHGITDKNAIVSALTSSATDAGPAGFDNEHGHGIVNAEGALSGSDTTPPTVSITSPSWNQTVSGNITSNVEASDDVAVLTVKFWMDGVYQGNDPIAPYQWPWDTTGLSDGIHRVLVEASDTSGNKAWAAVNFFVLNNEDVTPPSVSIASPAWHQAVSGNITANVAASDDVGVLTVKFWMDGVYQGNDPTAPYQWSWDTTILSDGIHRILVEASDTTGNKAWAAVNFLVSNNDITPPTLSITSPAWHETVSGMMTADISAVDNVGIKTVKFWMDGVYQGNDPTAPFQWTWDTGTLAPGIHRILVEASDHANNKAWAAVNFFVANDTTPPTVSITYPGWHQTVSGVLTASIDATDDTGILTVKFWMDGVYQGNDPTAGYEWTWDTATLSNGIHRILIEATDLAGNKSWAAVNFYVSN